jgi:hypothetical protein
MRGMERGLTRPVPPGKAAVGAFGAENTGFSGPFSGPVNPRPRVTAIAKICTEFLNLILGSTD